MNSPRPTWLTTVLVLVALSLPASSCGSSPGRPTDDVTGGTVDHSEGDSADRNSAGRDLAFSADNGRSAAGDHSGPSSQHPPSVVVAHVAGPAIVARSAPDEQAEVVVELTNPTEVGGPLAFQVAETSVDGIGAEQEEWLEVLLPIRPNGSTGWIRREEIELSRNPFRIEVDTSEHRLEVFRENVSWLSTTVAIGTGETPTPIGEYYIIELLQPPTPGGPYGPFAFGLSGFSETLTSFAGGDGVIGIHGTNDPAALGTDVSHGCIRVANDTIEAMAGTIPLGTPVVITT